MSTNLNLDVSPEKNSLIQLMIWFLRFHLIVKVLKKILFVKKRKTSPLVNYPEQNIITN